ncbi:DUF6417 family protein [Streptomyces avermitilis]|uniref:DUF6417 family protein n=1 Tax=Streptomyces avermitilis TaxID=33903 RepID=UPI0033A5A07E
MDDYEKIDLDEFVFAPMEHTTERLALLTLEEAHDVLRLLLMIAEKGEGPPSAAFPQACFPPISPSVCSPLPWATHGRSAPW